MKKVAIFIDHENMARCSETFIGETYNIGVLLDRGKEEGRVVVGKAYVPFVADTLGRSKYLYNFYKNGIEPVYTPSYKTGRDDGSKSIGDPLLLCDVMETLYEREIIDVFIICSGDKDIIPLIRKIAEKGKDCLVIGVAPASAQFLIEECNRLGFRFEDYAVLHKPIFKSNIVFPRAVQSR